MSSILFWLCIVVGLLWTLLSVQVVLALRRIPLLEPEPNADVRPISLSVVIPARDEARSLEKALGSILAQENRKLA